MALPKTGSRIPIGSGDDIPGSVSIDISETGSLAEELIGENQAFEAVQNPVSRQPGACKEQESGKNNGNSGLTGQSTY